MIFSIEEANNLAGKRVRLRNGGVVTAGPLRLPADKEEYKEHRFADYVNCSANAHKKCQKDGWDIVEVLEDGEAQTLKELKEVAERPVTFPHAELGAEYGMEVTPIPDSDEEQGFTVTHGHFELEKDFEVSYSEGYLFCEGFEDLELDKESAAYKLRGMAAMCLALAKELS